LLVEKVNDTPDHTPGVIHIERDLRGQFIRLELLHTQNNMLVSGADVDSGNKAELDHVRARQNRADGPLGQLAAIVLDLGSEHRTWLRIQLHSPVHRGRLVVPLIQGLCKN